MNVWVAIVIGLGSGLFGTLATISHEREAEFRRRMIEAADEFVGRAMSIVIAIRDSWLQLKLEDGTMTASAFEDETLDERMDRIFREIDALTLSLARVTLLFALERTVDAAGDVATAIAAARDRLWDARTEKAGGKQAGGAEIEEQLEAAMERVSEFTLVARRETRMGRIEYFLQRLQLAPSRKTHS